MDCPKCGAWSEVIETRLKKDKVSRRRECGNGHRFTTYELAVKGTVTDGPGVRGHNLTKRGLVKVVKLSQEV